MLFIQHVISGPDTPSSATGASFSLKNVEKIACALRLENAQWLGLATGPPRCGGLISELAIATPHRIFHLSLTELDRPHEPNQRSKSDLSSLFAASNGQVLAGFEMAHSIPLISTALSCPVTGIDLSMTVATGDEKLSPFKSPGEFINSVIPSSNHRAVNRYLEIDDENHAEESVCRRAWISAIAVDALARTGGIAGISRLQTSLLTQQELRVLSLVAARVQLLNASKPLKRENEFSEIIQTAEGHTVMNSRYKSRIRASDLTDVEMTLRTGERVIARAGGSRGRATNIKFNTSLSGPVDTIRVIGREELTNAERAQYELLVRILQGDIRLPGTSPFIDVIWFTDEKKILNRGECSMSRYQLDGTPGLDHVNPSQYEVVVAMCSTTEDSGLVIVHGPPGSGKTATISNAVKVWANRHEPVWIVAQSNVGVKNIAESLCRRDVDFRLVVSKEFYVEWHEGIYERVEEKLIRSDEFPDDMVAMERLFEGNTVILCTLSMLSNPIVVQSGLTKLVPVERLIIDEASQIDVFEFLPVFYKYHLDLVKVCFFGDPKQLPPYQAEQAGSQTIFEIKQLRRTKYFLNTQYRMPEPIGNFISGAMYDRKLRSDHENKDEYNCVRFVNVSKGSEEQRNKSFVNIEEVHTVIRLVQGYYSHRNYCIITPYDAQRAAISRELARNRLPDSVFNVDSFQGNEADYVIISTVRTEKPGFLASDKRANVMLTRCKKGMVVVTNSRFFLSAGAETLIGKLLCHWKEKQGAYKVWVDWREIVEKNVDLPGCVAPRPLPSPAPPAPVVIPNVDFAKLSLNNSPATTSTDSGTPSPSTPRSQTPQVPQRNHSSAVSSVTFPPSSLSPSGAVVPDVFKPKALQGSWANITRMKAIKHSNSMSPQSSIPEPLSPIQRHTQSTSRGRLRSEASHIRQTTPQSRTESESYPTLPSEETPWREFPKAAAAPVLGQWAAGSGPVKDLTLWRQQQKK